MPWLIGNLGKAGRHPSAGFADETLATVMLTVKAVGKRQAIRATAGVIRQAFVHKSIDMASPTQSCIRKRAGELHRKYSYTGLNVVLHPIPGSNYQIALLPR
jgi:hypothetical protein